MSNFMTDLIQRVEDTGRSFSSVAYTSIGDNILLSARIALTLYIWHYCCMVMFGHKNFNVGDILIRLTRMIIITMLIGNWFYFDFFVYKAITNIPEDVGRMVLRSISGLAEAEPTDGLMQIWNTANKVGYKIAEQSGFFTIMPNIIATCVWLIILVFAGISLAIIILAKMVMWVLVAVAPIFIGCFLFGFSKPLAKGWASQLLLYSIMPMFTYVVIALVIAMILPELATLDSQVSGGEVSWANVGTFCIASVAAIFIILNVHTITQGIVGAISTGVGNAARSILGSSAMLALSSASVGASASTYIYNKFSGPAANGSKNLENNENSKPPVGNASSQ